MRQIYKRLPVPWYVKQGLKAIYLRRPNAWKLILKEVVRLDGNRETLPLVAASARQFDPDKPWVLVANPRILTPDQDSSSVRMTAILHLLQEMGFQITFVSDSNDPLPSYQESMEKQGIVVFRGFDASRRHLADEGGKYHFVLLSRPELALKYLPYARAYALYSKIIYDTVYLHWIAFQREMNFSSDPVLADIVARFRRTELFNVVSADLALAITDEEKDLLLIEQPDAKVAVLPNIHKIHPSKMPFQPRKGLLFIGSFCHKSNNDAVTYFVNDIMPRVIKIIPDVVFYIIGSNMPDSIKALRSTNVEPLGFVQNVAPYFESCRIFVEPLRFGAGMKGNVGQSISYGLPVVTTRIAADDMGLQHEKHLLIADSPEDFAHCVIRLYSDEILWQKLSAGALACLDANYSYTAARKRMTDIFTLTRCGSGQNRSHEEA